MHKNQYNLAQAPRRLATCWRVVQENLRRANRLTHHALGFMLKLLVVGYFIFCALFLTLRYAVLPNIDQYKGEIEQLASKAIGAPLSVDTISASWNGLMPQLVLTDVRIRDANGREALRLPQVSATLSWWTAVVGQLRLHALEVVRPDIDIRRAADGQIYIGGVLVNMRQGGDGKGADWVLSQREIVVREGRVRWNDGLRQAPELILGEVNFVLRNRWQRHQMALHATPPASLAAPLDLRAEFHHPPFAQKISDFTHWKGVLYADLQEADVAAWQDYVDSPVGILQGKGAVRSWLSFDRAQVADFTADLLLSDVSARLRKDLDLLALAEVSGRVSVREALDPRSDGDPTSFGVLGHAVSLTDFSLRTIDGLRLPTTTISESFVPAKNGKPEKTVIHAQLLDLETLADFVERLPLPATQRQILRDFAPKGQIKEFSATWEGAYPDVSSYAVKGDFSALALQAQPPRPARSRTDKLPAQAALPAIPGFENLTGKVEANDRGGSFNLASDQLRLFLAGYFADPIMTFEQLQMQASWVFQANDQLLLTIKKMDFAQDGVAGSLSGTHLMPLTAQHGKPLGVIDLSGAFSTFDLQKIDNFLPLVTPELLRGWLGGALLGGTARDVKLRIKGNLAEFPFHAAAPNDKQKGIFSVSGKIDGGRLNYAPGFFVKDGLAPQWPLIEDINGTIMFDRTRMEIFAQSAKTHGVTLTNVKAVIPDLAPIDKMLQIDGSAAGPLQEFVGFVYDSPVTDWIAHFTEASKGSGSAKLTLKLQLPLAHMLETKVQGTLSLANNDVVLQPEIPPLLATSGKLDFNEKGLTLNGIRATFLGGPVTLAGGSQRDGSIQIKVDGNLTAEGLRKNYANTGLQALTDHVSGATRYSASINVRKQRPEIIVESSLQGLALDLPVPMRKAANDSMPLRFDMLALPSDNPLKLRDELKLSLGPAISARYLRQKSTEKNAPWQVISGGIGVNVPPPQPDSGLIANVSLKSLDIDAWRNLVSSANKTSRSKEVLVAADTLEIAQYIEPGVLAARADELIITGKRLDRVVVGASHEKDVWQANIDSVQASGYVTWNESPSGRGLGRVTARLSSLTIPESAASEVTELLEGTDAAIEMPGLDIVVEQFELFGKKFGHLELAANNVRASALREWRISKLSVVNDDAILKASGKWTSKGRGSVSNLAYTLDIGNAGKLLERFGFANVLRGGRGRMEGNLDWNGLPFSLDVPSLSGKLQLNIEAGQFLKVEPGAAKLLGVLSLQSLPRRLSLDFRDVFSEGFAFDGVNANATITRGLVKTDNFKMRSVNATVLLSGTANIAQEIQDLHVVVIPEINAGTASIVYALAVNPVIGIGSFLAQLFLREPLMRAFTFEYKITGPWKEPVVAKLNRITGTPGAAPAATAPLITDNVN